MDRSACKLVQFLGTIIKGKRSAILTSHSNRNKLHVQSNKNKLKQESIHAWITQPKTSLHAAQQVWVNTKQCEERNCEKVCTFLAFQVHYGTCPHVATKRKSGQFTYYIDIVATITTRVRHGNNLDTISHSVTQEQSR